MALIVDTINVVVGLEIHFWRHFSHNNRLDNHWTRRRWVSGKLGGAFLSLNPIPTFLSCSVTHYVGTDDMWEEWSIQGCSKKAGNKVRRSLRSGTVSGMASMQRPCAAQEQQLHPKYKPSSPKYNESRAACSLFNILHRFLIQAQSKFKDISSADFPFSLNDYESRN